MSEEQNSMYSLESTIPEYSLVKKAILLQYYNCQTTITTYDIKKTPNNERRAREQVLLLSRSLAFKGYVLKDKKLLNIFNSFLANPQNFTNFNIHLIFSICCLILEMLGLTRVETEELSKEKVFSEV